MYTLMSINWGVDMIRWSLAGEYMSFIVIFVLLLYFHEKRTVVNTRMRLYSSCLWLSMLSIVLNAVCVILIDHSDRVPYWLNMLLNSSYFMLTVLVCSLICTYMFIKMLEHVYDKKCLRRAFRGLTAVNVIYLAALLYNVKSGIIFYFDQTGLYHRGRWNSLGYGAMAVEIVMLYLCFFKNRPSVNQSIVKIIATLPPIILLLGVFQVTYPQLLMNGTAMAIADLILFISFQSREFKLDHLTTAGNRESFYENISLRMAGGQQFQIILLALRKFDIVNKNYGHKKGDEFLYTIATQLRRLIRGAEIFRFGNVEFALIVPYKSAEDSAQNYEAVKNRCREGWTVEDVHTHIRTAFMYMDYLGQHCTPSQLMDYIEFGISKSKEMPNHDVHFTETVRKEYEEEKKILEIMQMSVEQRRFRVWYQPVSHVEGGFYSAEALLRLDDYDGNPVPPSKFIPIAEESGMIDDLSWIVLEEVCELLEKNPQSRIRSISINLSMQQFADIGLEKRILDCLERHHLTAARLKIEVTERVLLHDMAYMKNVMYNMNRAGIGFYLDDFGTGYSNLASVLEFPFENVKLDRSLLIGFPGNPDSEMLVKTLIELFHSMGESVVVEGIEDEAQAELLKVLGADRIQGYYYSKPLPEEIFEKYYL